MRGILDRATDAAIMKLKHYVETPPKKGQIFATLELMSVQNYCLTYNLFFIKEDKGKKTLETEYAVNADAEKSFIPELDAYASKAFDGGDYSEAEQADFGPRQSKMLYEWFATCWKAAGGDHAKTPTYFAMNKEYMCQDISTGEIMEEEEAARRLGHAVEV